MAVPEIVKPIAESNDFAKSRVATICIDESVPSVYETLLAEVVIVAMAASLSCIVIVADFSLPLTLATLLSADVAVTTIGSLPSGVVSLTTVIVAVAEDDPLAMVIELALIVQSSPESAVESPFVF